MATRAPGDAAAVHAAVAELAASRHPYLLGVRHHSPACAAVMPELLGDLAPTRLLVELPAELETWLPWLGHPDLEAPVALSATRGDQAGALSFYPFADFSPELAAVRWAIARGVPVEAIDQPFLASRHDGGAPSAPPAEEAGPGVLAGMLRATGATSTEDLWDRLVEAGAPGSTADEVRRAALAFGWALRGDAEVSQRVSRRDRAREAYMRRRIRAALAAEGASGRVAAVVGSFHAAALLGAADDDTNEEAAAAPAPAEASWASSLVPYAFELLDSRSGYPAGIRDPLWQQQVWRARTDGTSVEEALTVSITAVVRELRRQGHVAGLPDATEAVRMALDLARLRRLSSPGRRELLEAVASAVGRGEPLGRGRVLARALETVLVGHRRGKLAPGTPRSGLVPHAHERLQVLRLPGPGDAAQTVRLDPLRSRLDRERLVALERLTAAEVHYAEPEEAYAGSAPGGARRPMTDDDTLGSSWRIEWRPATDATLELAGLRGVTLAQAAEGSLRARERRLVADDKLTSAARLALLRAAAACGLVALVEEGLSALMGPFLAEAGLADLVAAHALVQRIARGHVPALPPEGVGDLAAFALPPSVRPTDLVAAAIRAIEGLAGSTRVEDARALAEIVLLQERTLDDDGPLGGGRLRWAVERLARDGSPFMQGAAAAVLALDGGGGAAAATTFGVTFGSWIDGASAADLAARVAGALALAGPLLEADRGALDPILARVEALADDAFLARVASLRAGFDVLSAAARDRLLVALNERLAEDDDPRAASFDAALDDPPELLARWGAADRQAASWLLGAGLGPGEAIAPPTLAPERPAIPAQTTAHALSPRDRWRLLLGRERAKLSPAALRAGIALDELYGHGRGEGSRRVGAAGEAAFPTVREWSAELEAIFGAEVREEVLGRAAERGRLSAALELDPSTVTPSLELLESVLSLKGGLPEVHLARLRRLVQRIVDALVDALATRVRAALTGLSTPRTTRRAVGPLDLRATVAANLRRLGAVRTDEDGTPRLIPERLLFKTRARRSLDWHVVLVVDVSGSMEASVIHSAMMAAILSALPAVTVQFVAFNDRVIDLSARVDDPLGLLLEVSVGGGTDIAAGLRYARGLLTVPSRSLVVLVTDFEEGGSVPALLAEVRELAASGARPLGLASLDERGAPRYQRAIAELVVGAGMPVAALTPLELARWIAEQIR